jgi:hypothetical protein
MALAAAVGLWLGSPLLADDPLRFLPESGRSPATLSEAANNQTLADAVAARLRGGALRHYAIDVVVQDGVADLSGTVADLHQRNEALRLAQEVPGVRQVRDRLALPAGLDRVTQAQARGPMPTEVAPPPAEAVPPPGPGYAPAGPGYSPDPIAAGGPTGPFDFAAPKMPPFAWPTYSPYPNFSRVAYPEYYPYNCWPFIGPVYPFPKVPLGWRSVKLEWEDGHWWYSKVVTPHDWWRIRYW